jgi:hypothetical protein
MPLIVLPHRKYQLKNGELGTEWEALNESLQILEAKKRFIEEEIEIIRLRMRLAEGQPPP